MLKPISALFILLQPMCIRFLFSPFSLSFALQRSKYSALTAQLPGFI